MKNNGLFLIAGIALLVWLNSKAKADPPPVAGPIFGGGDTDGSGASGSW